MLREKIVGTCLSANRFTSEYIYKPKIFYFLEIKSYFLRTWAKKNVKGGSCLWKGTRLVKNIN